MTELKYGNFINGKEDFDGEETMLRSPVDGSEVATIYKVSAEKAEEAIEAAHYAFHNIWVYTALPERRRLLGTLADLIEGRSTEYAALESLITGKTMKQTSLMDIPMGIEHLRYFASGMDYPGERKINHPEFHNTEGIIQYSPVGVVGSIVPWNMPFLTSIWKLAPALLAGNTVVLKPSHYAPISAFELARDINRAGFPAGVVNVITGDGAVVGDTMVTSAKVNMLSFTGSTATGQKIAERGSQSMKRATLGLSGKSANVVFDDADLHKAARGVLFGFLLNSGQFCGAGSRLIIQRSVKEPFLELLASYIDIMRAGNPMDMETDLGAMTTYRQKLKVETMVNEGIKWGARKYYQKKIEGDVPFNGMYYPPTILTDVTKEMQVEKEEIFGPVLTVTEFETEAEAIYTVNSSQYGLSAGVWTGDDSRAMRVSQSLDCGTVWINEYHLISASAPKGGFKNSGIGRELGLEGVLEYTQTRHIFRGGAGGTTDLIYQVVVPEVTDDSREAEDKGSGSGDLPDPDYT